MKFRATILNAQKQRIGSETFNTWAGAAKKLRDTTHPDRKYSSIEIITHEKEPDQNTHATDTR